MKTLEEVTETTRNIADSLFMFDTEYMDIPTEDLAKFNIFELGSDSLDMVNFIMEIEDEFDMEITDEEVDQIASMTFGEICRFVFEKQGSY